MEDCDLNHSMSKKIAQLTKVIFHLNSKNEEHDAYLRVFTSAHEKQIEQIVLNANNRIRQSIEEIETLKSDKFHEKGLMSLKKQMEEGHQVILDNIQRQKAEYQKREQKLQKEFTDKAAQMTSELMEVKIKYAGYVEKYRECMAADSKIKSDLESSRAQNNEAMQLTARELLKEKENLQNQLRSALDKEDKMSSRLQEELSNQKKESEERENELRARIADSDQQLQHTRLSLRMAEEKQTNQQMTHHEELKRLESELEFANDFKSTMSTQFEKQQTETDKLEASIACTKLELQRETHLRHEAVSTLEEERKQTKFLGEQCNRLVQKLRQAEDRLQEQTSSTTQNFKALEKESKLEVEKLKAMVESKTEENESFASRLIKEQNLSKELRVELALKESVKFKIEAELKQRNEELATQLSNVSELLRKSEASKQECKGLQTTQSEEFRKHVEEIHEKHVEEKTKMETEMKLARERMYTENKAELEKIGDQHLETVTQLEKKVLEQQGLVTETKKLHDQRQRDLEQLQEHLRNEQTFSEKVIKQLQEKTLRLEEELAAVEEARSNECTKLQAQQKQCKALEQDLGILTAGRTKLEKELQEVKQQAKELISIRLENDRKLEEKCSEIEALQKKQQELCCDKENLNNQWEARLTETKSSIQNSLQSTTQMLHEVQEKAKQDIEATRQQWQNELLEKTTEYESQLDSMQCRHAKELHNMWESLTLEHEKNLNGVKSELSQLRASSTCQLQAIKSAHSKYVDEMATSHRKELENLTHGFDIATEKHSQEISKYQKLLEDAHVISEQQQCALLSTQESLKVKYEQIDKLEHELGFLQKRTTEETNALRTQQLQLIAQMEKEHEDALGEIKAAGASQLEESERRYQEDRDELEQRTSELSGEVVKLQQMFKNRPSREEDLRKLSEYETQLNDKKAIVKKLQDEKHFYQLELANREQNYNKVFGVTPNVGILNPLEKMKEKANAQLRNVQTQGSGGNVGLTGGTAGETRGRRRTLLTRKPSNLSLK